ncbi:hypothetical protein [Magnetospirillum sp. 15-1]|uniref:hypothetical protein n=1 Tax=Magnetospirillum sp. 15-1 TaxID=1979370 RepID=UPI000BBCECC6|nr:hypothetical protein [Magnetospirillum sp. 15-1]
MDAPIFDPETGEVLEGGGVQPPSIQAMSLDDARALLVRLHGVAISSDDPILMAVSLHQGFVADYEAMLRRHDEAIKGFLGATGEACVQAVDAVLSSLKDKTVKASLDQAFALVERQAVTMDALLRQLRRHRLIHALLTLVSVASCGLAIAVIRSALR